MNKKKYVFEVMCIDPEDIKNENSFSQALSFSDSLWKSKEVTINKDSFLILEQLELGITLKILTLDTSSMVADYIETAFILKISSENFDEIEAFRLRILKHLKAKLKFQQIRILRDDISTYIANELYPKINEVENLLRRYLIKFFIQRVGVEWWDVSADEKMLNKVKIRAKDRKDEFANYIKTDVEYADFDDLGHLIYKQSSGFNQPEKAIEQFLQISSIEDFESFKNDLQGNYTKYFKENFRDKSFEKLWVSLFKIRNKVAHQGTFYKEELLAGEKLHKELVEIIKTAESKIDELVLSVQEKEAIRNASIEALTEDTSQTNEEEKTEITYVPQPRVTIVGKIDDISYTNRTFQGHKVINEEDLLSELENAENLRYNDFVGLKWFVTQYLAEKNYSIGFSYSLINILVDKGIIELYDIQAYGGYDIKAIRRSKNE